MNNIVPLLIFGLIGIGIGLALGVLFCSWRNDGKLEETKRPEKQAVTASFPQKTTPTSTVQTVTTDKEEIILDRYSSTPNKTIGFKVTEDIVTVDDTDALYDNQQVNPNLTAPGADRYAAFRRVPG